MIETEKIGARLVYKIPARLIVLEVIRYLVQIYIALQMGSEDVELVLHCVCLSNKGDCEMLKHVIKTMLLKDLKPADYNPRKISKEAIAGLCYGALQSQHSFI